MSNLKTSSRRFIWITGFILALMFSIIFGGVKTKAKIEIDPVIKETILDIRNYEKTNMYFSWCQVKNAKKYTLAIVDSKGNKYNYSGKNTYYILKNTVNGRTYKGTLVSYDANGNKLGSSTKKLMCLQAVTVTSIAANNTHTKVTIKWKKNSKATGYKIYRSVGSVINLSKPYKTIKSNETVSFTDSVECGKYYEYYISAYNGDAMSDGDDKDIDLRHVKDSGTATVKATCTAQGTTVYKCKFCKATMTTTHPAALGHSYGAWTATKEATCQQAGVETRRCTRAGCIASETRDVAKKDHEKKAANPETHFCEEGGYRYYVCKYCNMDMGSEWISAQGHIEVIDPEIPATCAKAGKTQGSHCSECGKIISAQTVIPKTSEHKIVKDPEVAPTKTKDGKTAGSHCAVCGKVFKSQQKIPKLKTPAQAKLGALENNPDDNAIFCNINMQKDADGYIVYRKTGNGKFKQIRVIKEAYEPDMELAAIDLKVKPGKVYTYAIKAFRSYKGKKYIGKMSKPKSIMRIPECKFTKGSSSAAGSVTLNWKKFKLATGYQIDAMIVSPKGDVDRKTMRIVKGGSTTSTTIPNLKKGYSYSFFVRAIVKKGKNKYYGAWTKYNGTINFSYPRKVTFG